MYNQFNRKYTKDDIINIYRNCETKTEFLNKGLKKAVKFYNLKLEIDEYFDNISQNNKIIHKESTIKEIDENINKYSSISEFRKNKPELYYYWNLWKLPSPYIKQKISIPQLLITIFYEFMFDEKCFKNYRKILNGKELDIYFNNLKIAIEYNGWYWHKNRVDDDIMKQKLCADRGILLFIIQEPYNNAFSNRDILLEFVKNNFKQNVKIIEKFINKKIDSDRLEQFEIDEMLLLKEVFSHKDIQRIIDTCDRYSKLKTDYNKIWQYLLRNKLLHLVEPVKKRDYIYMEKHEFIKYILRTFTNYTEFSKHKVYQLARKRKYLSFIKTAFEDVSL